MRWRRRRPTCRPGRPAGRAPLIATALLLAFLAPRALAQQATPTSIGPVTLVPNQDSEPAGDLLSPQNLLQLQYQVKTTDGTNADGEPRNVTTDTFKLRGDIGIELDASSQLILRGDLPYLAKNPVNDANPGGDFVYGIGDADLQIAVIHAFDGRWMAGVGFRLIMPTGGSAFGSQTWRAMPLAGVRYALPEISRGSYFEPLMRYDVSFAGNPEARSVNNLQFAPLVNFALPDRWFFTLYPSPEIRWNFGDPVTGQTGRLFLPLDVRVGKKFSDLFNVSLEVSVPIVKQYPVYNFMTALRLNLTF